MGKNFMQKKNIVVFKIKTIIDDINFYGMKIDLKYKF